MNAVFSLFGRLGLALVFLVSGWGKIAGYGATQGYMDSMGVPGALLPLVIALELGGGLAIVAGLQTRWIAIALAVFSIASALVFHADFSDQNQAINFWKNAAIAGGFLVLAASGPGIFSLDAVIARGRVMAAQPRRA